MYPPQPGNTIIQAGRERRYLGYRTWVYRIAEIYHCHGDTPRCDHAAPGFIIAQVAGTELHTATVYIINAGQCFVIVRADKLDIDRITIRGIDKRLSSD